MQAVRGASMLSGMWIVIRGATLKLAGAVARASPVVDVAVTVIGTVVSFGVTALY